MWLTQPFGVKTPDKPTHPVVFGILMVWFLLLLPWLPFALLSGMAFDGGDTRRAYLFVWSMWLYPATAGTAFFCRKDAPILALLPLLNIAGVLIAG